MLPSIAMEMNMFTRLLILATESLPAEEGGFGLDFDIFETNIINLAILVGVVFYFGRKTLTNILSERRSKIAEEIQEAEDRQRKAAAALAEEEQKLAQAQDEAERIRQSAEERAVKVKAEINAQLQRDLARLQDNAAKNLSSEQDRVVVELRQRIAQLAIAKAEEQLKLQLNDRTQERLIDRSIAQLGGRS